MPMPVEHPLAYYGTLAAAMSSCLYLFVSVARKLEDLTRSVNRRLGDGERESGVIGTQLAGLEAQVGEWAGQAIRRSHAISAGVDANQRTQVLRLARRGDRAEQIAAELHVPRIEVDLLLKVQRAMINAT